MPKRFFSVQKKDRSKMQIISWWELRRIPFNIILFIALILLLKLLNISIMSIEMGSGEYFILLMSLSLIMIFNIVYTCAWILELIKSPSQTYAPKVLKFGIASSLLCLSLFISTLLFIL